MCIFSSHSIIRDPPFSRLDLISCRNLMIYLKPELQAQIIPLFHYSLRPNGFFVSGSSDKLSLAKTSCSSSSATEYVAFSGAVTWWRACPSCCIIFYRNRDTEQLDRRRAGAAWSIVLDMLRRVSDTIVEHFAPSYVIVNETGQTLYFSHRAPANICNPRLAHPIGTSLRWPLWLARGFARRAAPRQGNWAASGA